MKVLTSIAEPIQVLFFNTALHTVYNSCEGLTRAFEDRIIIGDVLGKKLCDF